MSQCRPRSWQEMRDQEIRWLIERTGEGLHAWNAKVRAHRSLDQKPTGRLELAKNFAQSSVTHKIGLTSADDVDDEVVGWLKRSYNANI